MKFAIEIETTYAVIAPDVALMDKDAAEALCAKVKEGLAANPNLSFIVDIGVVEQLSSESIYPLMCLQQTLEAAEGTLVIANPQELVLQKIKQERLHLSIQVASSLEEAIDLVKNNETMARRMLNEM